MQTDAKLMRFSMRTLLVATTGTVLWVWCLRIVPGPAVFLMLCAPAAALAWRFVRRLRRDNPPGRWPRWASWFVHLAALFLVYAASMGPAALIYEHYAGGLFGNGPEWVKDLLQTAYYPLILWYINWPGGFVIEWYLNCWSQLWEDGVILLSQWS